MRVPPGRVEEKTFLESCHRVVTRRAYVGGPLDVCVPLVLFCFFALFCRAGCGAAAALGHMGEGRRRQAQRAPEQTGRQRSSLPVAYSPLAPPRGVPIG